LPGEAVRRTKAAEGAGVVGRVTLTPEAFAEAGDRFTAEPIEDDFVLIVDDLTAEELDYFDLNPQVRRPRTPVVLDRSVEAMLVDIEEALATYVHLFGGTLEHRQLIEEQGVNAASVLVGGARIELLAPTGPDTPVGKFLAKRGPGMHHIAYEVDDVGAELRRLAADGVNLIDERPRRGLFGLEVAFIHPDAVHGVLAELVANVEEH
jgi:methylmalonyl-CoA epimerase